MRNYLLAATFAAATMAGTAMAAPIAGNSDVSNFSNLTGGGSLAQLYNGSGNTNSGVRWGDDDNSNSNGLTNPSTLVAANVSWSANTNTNDTVISQLVWYNSSTPSNRTPDNFDVTYNVSLDFSTPNLAAFGQAFPIDITNTTNPQGDISDLTVSAQLTSLLAAMNAQLNPQGIAVSDLKFSLASGSYGTYNATDGVWTNPEGRTSTLNLTADFRSIAVPEPATIGLLGMGLVGLGFASRRRRA